MDIENFIHTKEQALRALPIFILADISSSMRGEKINQLNLALREMIQELKNTPNIPGKFKLSLITFNSQVKIVQPLEDVDKIELPQLHESGVTVMEDALKEVAKLIEDHNVVDSRSYTPTIVLMSDGAPTDCTGHRLNVNNDWEPLRVLHTGRCARAQRLALAIGADADKEILRYFIDNPEIPLIEAANAAEISRFFKWVTMSVITRMKSTNPNDIVTFSALGLPEITDMNKMI